MSLSVGIVGLPNVGKSTLFNALLKKQQALAANYPFATIEPNVGVVPVPDERLAKLADTIEKSEGIRPPEVPATVKFIDIAGLVAGASQGEGLGNKFLSHIRETDAIAYVLRGFTDENIIRAGSESPEKDLQILETELLLADLETVGRAADSKDRQIKAVGEKIKLQLEQGRPVREMKFGEEEEGLVRQMNLLTAKPAIRVLNVDEDQLVKPTGGIAISAKMESELAELSPEEQSTYLAELGVSESGLARLVKEAFGVLGLQSFLTAGIKEVRAWTIRKGMSAPQAAGVIHTDFEKHFIKAEIIPWGEFVEAGGWLRAREAGRVRTMGRDYEMQEGDVVEFKVGVQHG